MKTVFSIFFLFVFNTFLQSQNYETITVQMFGSELDMLSPADVDGDGDTDFFAEIREQEDVFGRIVWLENEGDNSFVEHDMGAPTGVNFPSVFYVVDVDSDGDTDVLASGSILTPTGDDYLVVYLNDGGTFTIRHISDSQQGYSNFVESGGEIYMNGGGADLGNLSRIELANGILNAYTNVVVHQAWAEHMVAGDYDSDGDVDLAVFSWFFDLFYFENSANSFLEPIDLIESDYEPPFSKMKNVIFQDDGSLDIILSHEGDILIFDNNGSAEFEVTVLVEGLSGYVSMIDFNNNGLQDIIVSGTHTYFLRNMGDETFSEPQLIMANSGSWHSFGDFDADGIVDILFKPVWGSVSPKILLNHEISGCSDPLACNFNIMTNLDDGSCLFGSVGCTDDLALNYNAEAVCPDVCLYETGDSNGDGQVTAVDLGEFLSSFGTSCPPLEYCFGDLNGDLSVTAADLAVFITLIGQ